MRISLAPVVEKMLRAGAGNDEIYATLEGTYRRNSIRTIMSQQRKKLGFSDMRGGKLPRVHLSNTQRSILAVVAEEYGVSVNTLVSRIVSATIDDDMFEAILDHKEKEMVIPWPLPKS